MFKSTKGKYVAPSPIEMKLSANKNIENVCVVGDGLPQPIALVVLSKWKRQVKRRCYFKFGQNIKRSNPKLDHHEKVKRLVVLQQEGLLKTNYLLLR